VEGLDGWLARHSDFRGHPVNDGFYSGMKTTKCLYFLMPQMMTHKKQQTET
jgi:hypothetical protein